MAAVMASTSTASLDASLVSSGTRRSRAASLLSAVAPSKARIKAFSLLRHSRPQDENVDTTAGSAALRKTSSLLRRASSSVKRKATKSPVPADEDGQDMGSYVRRAQKMSKSVSDLNENALTSFQPWPSNFIRTSEGGAVSRHDDIPLSPICPNALKSSVITTRTASTDDEHHDKGLERQRALDKLTNGVPTRDEGSDVDNLVRQVRQIFQSHLHEWIPDDLESSMAQLVLWSFLSDGTKLCRLLNCLFAPGISVQDVDIDRSNGPTTSEHNFQLFILAARSAIGHTREVDLLDRDDFSHFNLDRFARILRVIIALEAAAPSAQSRQDVLESSPGRRLRASTTLHRVKPSVTFAGDVLRHDRSSERQGTHSIYGDKRKAESAVELTSVAEEDVARQPVSIMRSKTRISSMEMKRHNSDSPNARRRFRLSSELPVSMLEDHGGSPVRLIRLQDRRSMQRSYSSNDTENMLQNPVAESRPSISHRETDVPVRPVQHQRWNSEVYIDRSPLESSGSPRASRNDIEANEARSPKTLKVKLVLREKNRPTLTYQLGECIGRGQFGSVYRALNLNSGRIVAVKRIMLEDKSEAEVEQLSNEIDLLKRLEHPAVVKYEGLVRTQHYLNIILEYVENGSLLTTLKHFGELPESLVASYVVKILEGLVYLHSQNVVHCDLKAANILTNKHGNIKLSDFGVSLNLNAVQNIKQDVPSVNGTPYWMAPEVIELQGPSRASDIWSLGCTVIEMLTGKPPYAELVTMSAMFRIVTDPEPPLPRTCSPELRDFLHACFAKDPKRRPSAKELLTHEWIQKNWDFSKDLRPQDSLPFLRRISTEMQQYPRVSSNLAFSQSTSSLVSPPASGLASPVMSKNASTDSPFGGGEYESHEGLAALLRKSIDERRSMDVVHDHADRSLRAHAFVNTSFSKAVECKLCGETTKRHAVLCKDCGLVAHSRCTEFAPLPCDLRSQLLGYSTALVRRPAPEPRSPTSSLSNFSFGQMLPNALHRPRRSKTTSSSTATGSPARGSNSKPPVALRSFVALSGTTQPAGSTPPGSMSSVKALSRSSLSTNGHTGEASLASSSAPPTNTASTRVDAQHVLDDEGTPITNKHETTSGKRASLNRSTSRGGKLQKPNAAAANRTHSRTQSATMKDQCSIQ